MSHEHVPVPGCLDHDPPLKADGESGQHLYDLPQIRKDIRRRASLPSQQKTPGSTTMGTTS